MAYSGLHKIRPLVSSFQKEHQKATHNQWDSGPRVCLQHYCLSNEFQPCSGPLATYGI